MTTDTTAKLIADLNLMADMIGDEECSEDEPDNSLSLLLIRAVGALRSSADTIDSQENIIEFVRAERDQLAKDAARYRWLRNPETRGDEDFEDVAVVGYQDDVLWLEQLDRHIDTLLATQPEVK